MQNIQIVMPASVNGGAKCWPLHSTRLNFIPIIPYVGKTA